MAKDIYIWAYLAGAIDGDGTIGLYQHKSRKARRQFSWRPALRIINTDKGWLKEIKKDLDMGRISKLGFTPNTNKKVVYELSFTSNEIREILPNIIPFLRIKKRNAELLIAVLNITKNHRRKKYKEEIDKIDILIQPIYEELKILNHRGKL